MRVVVWSSSSPASLVGGASLLVVALLVVALPEVVALPDVVDSDGVGLISVVSGGLVLVMVAVVAVVAARVWLSVAENVGSTKSSGASVGASNRPATKETASTRIPIAATPSTLAPTTSGVRLYQGCGGVSSPPL